MLVTEVKTLEGGVNRDTFLKQVLCELHFYYS